MIHHLKGAFNISKGMDVLERIEQFDTFAKSNSGMSESELYCISILILFVIWLIGFFIIASKG